MGGKQAKQTNGNTTNSALAKPQQALKSSGTFRIPKLLISRKQAVSMETQ